jgi:hypothetical protein
MVPVMELLAAYGVVAAVRNAPKKLRVIGIGIFVVLFTLNSLYFFHQYFIHSSIHRNWNRNEGFGEMVAAVKKDYASYDKIIITKSEGGIYPLILFYTGYDPQRYLQEGFPKDKAYSGFGKFFFVDASCPSIERDSRFPKANKTIYVDNGTCPDYKGLEDTKHKYITRKDGTKVFRIVYE